MGKLKQAARQIIVDWDSGIHLYEAITALREALAEPDIEEMTLTQIAARHEQAEQEPLMITPGGGAFPFAVVGELEQAEQSQLADASLEPVGVFANVNALTPEKGARWEQMIDSAYDGVEYIHLYAAPVRTKDLTDDEIAQAVGSPLDEVYLADFRAVIAADREKNK